MSEDFVYFFGFPKPSNFSVIVNVFRKFIHVLESDEWWYVVLLDFAWEPTDQFVAGEKVVQLKFQDFVVLETKNQVGAWICDTFWKSKPSDFFVT